MEEVPAAIWDTLTSYFETTQLIVDFIPTFQNKVFRVTHNKQVTYLKIFADTPRLAKKLASLYPALKNHGVQVPDVTISDSNSSPPFILLSAVSGNTLFEVKKTMSEQDLVTIYKDLGVALAKIHTLTFDKFGETFDAKTVEQSEEYSVGPVNSWKEMHAGMIAARLKVLEHSIFDDILDEIRTYFEENSTMIDYSVTPRLLHEDLNQKNIFVKDGLISGIIDFDGSFIGHSEEELMRTISGNFPTEKTLETAFLDGYSKIIPLDKGYEERRPFYYLSRQLVHARCLVQFKDSYKENWKEVISQVKEEIRRVIAGEKPNYGMNS